MFSKSLFLATTLLSVSAAFSLPSKPVQGNPAIIPLPSALDVGKNKPGFLVGNMLPVSKTGDRSCIASFVTGFSGNLQQIKVSLAPSATNAVQIILKKKRLPVSGMVLHQGDCAGRHRFMHVPCRGFLCSPDPQTISGKGYCRPLDLPLHDHHGQPAFHMTRHHD